MNTEIKLIKDHAETIYISHEKYSYAVFCFNSMGDLFMNSDWGFFGYAWRSFGKDFKSFLSNTNSEYVMGKFEINNYQMSGKRLGKRQKESVEKLVEIFINELKN